MSKSFRPAHWQNNSFAEPVSIGDLGDVNASVTEITLVNSHQLLDLCINDLAPNIERPIRRLAVDLEGVDLCRSGRISILQIWEQQSSTIWLVDVTTLGASAFDHEDPNGRTLKMILEDEKIVKLFFDVRNDADALFHLYGVNLKNVYDLQILDVAVRLSHSRRVGFVNGLKRTIGSFLIPPGTWNQIKELGHRLFNPDKGGSYEVFEQRPLDDRLIAYCAQDVSLLFALEAAMKRCWGRSGGGNWEFRVGAASSARVAMVKGSQYDGKSGRDRAIAPLI